MRSRFFLSLKMALNPKKWLVRCGIAAVTILVTLCLLNRYIKQKVTSYLTELPAHVQLHYDDIDVNTFTGSINLKAPIVKIFNLHSNNIQFQIHSDSLSLKGLDYSDLILNKEIVIDALHINGGDFNYRGTASSASESKTNKINTWGNTKISVNSIVVANTALKICTQENDTTLAMLDISKLNLNGFGLRSNQTTGVLSYAYEAIMCEFNSLYLRAGTYEDLHADHVTFNNDKLKLEAVQLKTRYTPKVFSKLLAAERDHYNITTDSMVLRGVDFDFWSVNKPYLSIDSVRMFFPKIAIYRDKLVNDSYVIKPLYSKMLRDIAIDLSINKFETIDGKLSYSERVKTHNSGGRLYFDDLNTTALRLGNTYASDTTHIVVKSKFMGRSDLEVNWKFVIQDSRDNFSFSGVLDNFNAENINAFTQPNLNVEFKGHLIKTYFDIYGDARTSDIDMLVKFDDFKVVVLKKGGHQRNKFMSKLVNIFVPKTSRKMPNNFNPGHTKAVKRDRTKSVFNYVWKNVQSGLMSAMTGTVKRKN